VFDEAHEYLDEKVFVGDLENAMTQIRHDGVHVIMATQFPERIPERLLRYFNTRFVFKLSTGNSLRYLRRHISDLDALTQRSLADLELESGLCFVQSNDRLIGDELRKPRRLHVRPRVSLHGGATKKHLG